MQRLSKIPCPAFLGIEGGATRCGAILGDAGGRCVQRLEVPTPGNVRLLSAVQLLALLGKIGGALPRPAAVGIGLAGALDEADRERIRAAAARVWPRTPCWAGHDLETALAAAGDAPGPAPMPRVIVISGTGASCYGQRADGREVLTAGWGHLLGDRGSGYDIALSALQAVFHSLDETGRWPALGQRLLRTLGLGSPSELISWVGAAPKATLAALAVEVFAAAAARDRIAAVVLHESAEALACAATACARRLAGKEGRIEFVLTGSVLRKQPGYARRLGKQLKQHLPEATVKMLAREGAWGAVFLARREMRAREFLPNSE